MVAFLVEDGTGLAAATSYVDEAFSDDYLGAAWAVDSATKQAALIAATEYVDLRYGNRFLGKPLVYTQALEFPRLYLYDRYGTLIEGVPSDLKKATCQYAVAFVAGTLYQTVPTTTSKEVKKKKVTVGPITTETEYQGSATASSWLKFPIADNFMSTYITSSGVVIRA